MYRDRDDPWSVDNFRYAVSRVEKEKILDAAYYRAMQETLAKVEAYTREHPFPQYNGEKIVACHECRIILIKADKVYCPSCRKSGHLVKLKTKSQLIWAAWLFDAYGYPETRERILDLVSAIKE